MLSTNNNKINFIIPNIINNDNFIIQYIKNRQLVYYKLYDKDNKVIEILESQEDFYKTNRILCYKIVDSVLNEHQDLANFRKFFEWLNIKTYALFKGIFTKVIIDIGGSARLFSYLVCRYILRCELSNEDILRNEKIDYTSQPLIQLSNKLVQDFVKDIDTKDVILNFTDVLYYIRPDELLEIYKDFEYGVVGLFTLHIFTGYTDIKVLNKTYGNVIYLEEENSVIMTVNGNFTFYKHRIDYNVLYHTNHMIIAGDKFSIILKVEDRLDLRATNYVRGVITKTKDIELTYIQRPRVIQFKDDRLVCSFNSNGKMLITLNYMNTKERYIVLIEELVKLYKIFRDYNADQELTTQQVSNIVTQIKWTGQSFFKIMILVKRLYENYKRMIGTKL